MNTEKSPTKHETPLASFLSWADEKLKRAMLPKPLTAAERDELIKSGRVYYPTKTMSLDEAKAMAAKTKLLTSKNLTSHKK